MTDHRTNEIVIVDGLKSYLSTDLRTCEVVRMNQVSPVPPYPYVSYSITTLIVAQGGTYSSTENGTLYRTIRQIWSFTVQSDDQEEALTLAMKIYDYFTAVGITFLADNDITVRQVTNITARDNLLSVQYEYRNGLDVTFGLLYTITPENQISRDVIESNTFNKEE